MKSLYLLCTYKVRFQKELGGMVPMYNKNISTQILKSITNILVNFCV